MNPREQSVRHLANLFTVVVGLGLSAAIYNFVDPNGRVLPFLPTTFILCIAYVATLLPFYHGAMRHLDDRHASATAGTLNDGALLADFIILFIEGCWFIALGALVNQPIRFVQGYALLMAVDVGWGVLAHLAFAQRGASRAELRWAAINFFTAALLFGLMQYYDIVPWMTTGSPQNITKCALTICGIAILRTALDYMLTWRLYFPLQA